MSWVWTFEQVKEFGIEELHIIDKLSNFPMIRILIFIRDILH